MQNLLIFRKPLFCIFITDGRKIAIKLSKQIRSDTKQLEALVKQYGASLSDVDSADGITLEEVLDPMKLEDRLRSLGVWCLGTVPEKREAMDAYLIVRRSEEELAMLRAELQAVARYHRRKKEYVVKAYYEVQSLTDSPYNRGIASLLMKSQTYCKEQNLSLI